MKTLNERDGDVDTNFSTSAIADPGAGAEYK